MTLGDAAAGVRLIIWCTECQHQVGPDPAEQITSAMFTGMGLLGIAPKRPCSIGANAGLFLARQPAGRYGGDRDQVGVAPPWHAHTVARTRAETPDAHCAFGEQSRATGLQMPRMSSTIPAPTIIISETAPAPAQKPAAQSSA